MLFLDEADYHLLDRQYQPPTCIGVIALSATTIGAAGGNEEAFLDKQGFRVIDSLIAPSFDAEQALATSTKEEFFSCGGKQMAALVYCSEDDAPSFATLARKYEYNPRVNVTGHEELRRLTPYDCVIQTHPDAMRGVDYRACSGGGLKLLLARSLPNQRAYIQSLGRVGRYAEACDRYILEGVNAVDEDAQIALCSKLREACAQQVKGASKVRK